MVVNLVRSGRKQPQLFFASAGGQARLPFVSAGASRRAHKPDRLVAPMTLAHLYARVLVTQALARKWRPRNFDQLVGQEHVVRALTNALRQKRLHHAYL